MAELGMGGRFWFKSALQVAAWDASNATYKERIGTTPWRRMHGEMRDVSRFRAAAEHGSVSTKIGEKMENIRHVQ